MCARKIDEQEHHSFPKVPHNSNNDKLVEWRVAEFDWISSDFSAISCIVIIGEFT